MKTSRLVLLLIVLGGLVALLVQNTRPALALTFLGWQTPLLPLALWLVLALVAGALTSLALGQLLSSRSLPKSKSKYRPTAYSRFSEEPSGTTADERSQAEAPYSRESYAEDTYAAEPMGSRPAADSEWGEWTRLKSPTQRDDWEQPAPQVDFAAAEASRRSPPQPQSSSQSSSTGSWWPFGNRAEEQQRRAENSWQDLAEGWEDLEDDDRYRPQGGSPVHDALDDINEGWEGSDSQPDYQDDSFYSYSYDDEDNRQDNVYGPADESADEETAEAGVVDADYRVIIPPYSPAADESGEYDDDDDDNWVDGKTTEGDYGQR